MAHVMKALLLKNLQVRLNSFICTLLEILAPLSFALLSNWVSKENSERGQRLEILLEPIFPNDNKKIIYNHPNEFAKSFMRLFAERNKFNESNVKTGEMSELLNSDYYYGLRFLNSSLPKTLEYTLFPGNGPWLETLHEWYNGLTGGATKMIFTLSYIQNAIHHTYAASLNSKIPRIRLREMDNYEGRSILVYLIFSTFFLCFCLALPVVTRVIQEKALGSKELMRLMGVKTWQLWLAKLIDTLSLSILVLTLLVVIFYQPFFPKGAPMLINNALLFWFLFTIELVGFICFLFFFSCFFYSTLFGAISIMAFFFFSLNMFLYEDIISLTWMNQTIKCFLPHFAILYTVRIFYLFDFHEKELRWSEVITYQRQGIPLVNVTIISFSSIFIYSVLTWYLINIWPGPYGVPRPWYFCFLMKEKVIAAEENPRIASSAISAVHLRKVYRKFRHPSFVAVDDVSLEIGKGRITALLGHNGAGKSTTMHMLTGMTPPTSGSVFIDGVDIQKNINEARKSLGLCPQHDFLFSSLTVWQTLIFCGMIKGLSRKEAAQATNELLRRLKLASAKNKVGSKLSGGMKRKLSLGMAIIGGSKILILDEPTAGVDPQQRREITDILLSYRNERTILLTTHIMEEADAVSDYIYVLEHGKVRTAGTPLDLKNKFGTGYILQVVVNGRNAEEIKKMVKGTIPGSQFKSQNAANVTFQLPSNQTKEFSRLFDQLDSLKSSGSVSSYSISIATLEDVFMKLREKDNETANEGELGGKEEAEKPYQGHQLFFQQIRALIIKKFHYFINSWNTYLLFAIIPFAMLLLLTELFVKTRITGLLFIDYGKPLYPEMELLVQENESCIFCNKFLESLQPIAEKRGFVVKKLTNVSEVIQNISKTDFHRYTSSLALSLEFFDEEIKLLFNPTHIHVILFAVEMVNGASISLNNTAARISSSINLTYAHNDDPETSFGADLHLVDLIPLQIIYYLLEPLAEKLNGAKAMQLMAAPATLYWFTHFALDIVTFFPCAAALTFYFHFWFPDDTIFDDTGIFVTSLVPWSCCYIFICYHIASVSSSKNMAIIIILIIILLAFFLDPFFTADLISKNVGYAHPSLIWNLKLDNGTNYRIYLFYYALALLALLLLSETTILGRIFQKLLASLRIVRYKIKIQEDADVKTEAEEIASLISSKDRPNGVLMVSQLRKTYGLSCTPAVRGVSFRINPGECFGLMGVNGAGKSTTFNMLTTQIVCSGGDAVLNNAHLSALRRKKYLKLISYCPQNSSVIPKLTGRQYLMLFARLCGYRDADAKHILNQWIKALDLQDSIDRRCDRYSGGTGRKLSAAVAFLWDSKIIMLDEPTAGVDPVARRSLWNAVTQARESGRSILLTSHSLEECEAMCSRSAIMVKGSFRCIGETAKLKSKFGGGFTVQIKVASASSADLLDFQTAVQNSFGDGCTLTDSLTNILFFKIEEHVTNSKTLFRKLEDLKSKYSIFESYSASETSLEDIFIAFAKE